MTKYHNKPIEIDGHRFASQKEGKRFAELRLLEKAKAIRDLDWQVPFRLEVNGQLICRYVADFTYTEDGKPVVEDTKGVRTPVYKLKAKLMKAVLGIEIRET